MCAERAWEGDLEWIDRKISFRRAAVGRWIFRSTKMSTISTLEKAHDSDDAEATQRPEESIYTDDPVRVYLRDMGSIPLLTRKREVGLARTMERGKLRVQRSVSRSAMVQALVVEYCDQLKKGTEEVETYVYFGNNPEETAAALAQRKNNVRQIFIDLIAQQRRLKQVSDKLNDIPRSNKKLRRRWKGKHARALVRVSITIRSIPFRPVYWRQFTLEIERAYEELFHLDGELRRVEERGGPHAASRIRELKREIREREAIAGTTLPEIRHSLTMIRLGDREAEQAKKDLVAANLRLVDLRGEKVRESGTAPTGFDPRGQHRLDDRGRQIRLPKRLQVFDLCDLVDSPGGHASDCRPIQDHPYSGSHEREHEQVCPGQRVSLRRSSAARRRTMTSAGE